MSIVNSLNFTCKRTAHNLAIHTKLRSFGGYLLERGRQKYNRMLISNKDLKLQYVNGKKQDVEKSNHVDPYLHKQ